MSYILRRKGWGDLLPTVAEVAGLELYTSGDILPAADYAFRWGCTAEVFGKTKIINKVPAIKETNNKANFRATLSNHLLAPRTWLSLEDYLMEEEVPRIVVVRPENHARSENVHLCKTKLEVKIVVNAFDDHCYISEYIHKDKEFRVFVAQGKIAWMIEKIPKNKDDVSWGCVEEGQFKYVNWSDWPQDVMRVSLLAMETSSLDFGAVDVIVKNDKAYALEINTAPFLTPYYAKTVGKVFKHMVENGREFKYAQLDDNLDWHDIIHPALVG